MKNVFILADSGDPDEMHPDEMQLYVAFSSGSSLFAEVHRYRYPECKGLNKAK